MDCLAAEAELEVRLLLQDLVDQTGTGVVDPDVARLDRTLCGRGLAPTLVQPLAVGRNADAVRAAGDGISRIELIQLGEQHLVGHGIDHVPTLELRGVVVLCRVRRLHALRGEVHLGMRRNVPGIRTSRGILGLEHQPQTAAHRLGGRPSVIGNRRRGTLRKPGSRRLGGDDVGTARQLVLQARHLLLGGCELILEGIEVLLRNTRAAAARRGDDGQHRRERKQPDLQTRHPVSTH